jgi:hypothetical protein
MPTNNTIAAIVMALLAKGIAGALFGALFAGLHQVLVGFGLSGGIALILATAAAAMTTSAFYSAMPIALVGTMASVLASIGYLIAAGSITLFLIVAISGSAGAIAGSCYAWMITSGSRPLAETFAGMLAGVLTGGSLALALVVTGKQVDMLVLAAIVAVFFGIFFQILKQWLAGEDGGWLPNVLSAPLVGGLIAAVVGASIWFMGGQMTALLDAQAQFAVGQVLKEIPAGLMCGLLGGSMIGLFFGGIEFHVSRLEMDAVSFNVS